MDDLVKAACDRATVEGMEAGWLARARWRWRGAWLWPTFVAAAAFDGVLARVRPFAGDRQSFYGGLLVGLIANLLAVVLLSRVLGAILRRRRRDLPVAVARNYGGTIAVVAISAGLLALGLGRHPGVEARQAALRDAVVRAEAYIGTHAPAEFRVNASFTDTYVIQPGAVYRTCVPSRFRPRYYCVIVKPRLPLARSVVPAGSEPNQTMSLGTD
jgi:hypothetical protein